MLIRLKLKLRRLVVIFLKDKDIEYYIWNHPRQSGGPLGIRWNTSSENGRTGKVVESMSENDMIFLLQNAGYTLKSESMTFQVNTVR